MDISRHNNSRSKLGFGKVVKFSVYVNGLPTIDEKKVRLAIRSLTQILQKQDTKHPGKDVFIRCVKRNVSDYSPPAAKIESNKAPIIRNLIDSENRFLFTGSEAVELHPLAKAIGKAKGISLKMLKTTKTYESRHAADNYFNKAKEFVNNPELRASSPSTGRPLELKIFTSKKSEPGSNKFNLMINNIRFDET